jgi:hypothetical protein
MEAIIAAGVAAWAPPGVVTFDRSMTGADALIIKLDAYKAVKDALGGMPGARAPMKMYECAYHILSQLPSRPLDALGHGDVIRTEFTYRNEGVIGLYHERTGIIPLDYDTGDDYGMVPSGQHPGCCCCVSSGMPMRRWFTVFDGGFPFHHNVDVWVDMAPYADQIRTVDFTLVMRSGETLNVECRSSRTLARVLADVKKGPIALSMVARNGQTFECDWMGLDWTAAAVKIQRGWRVYRRERLDAVLIAVMSTVRARMYAPGPDDDAAADADAYPVGRVRTKIDTWIDTRAVHARIKEQVAEGVGYRRAMQRLLHA